jgi:hypothetical protein
MRMKAHCLATSNNAREYQLPTTDSLFYACCRRWSLKYVFCGRWCWPWRRKARKDFPFFSPSTLLAEVLWVLVHHRHHYISDTLVIPTHKIQLNTYFKNLLQKFIKNITPNKENRFEPQKHRFAINRSQNESTKNRFFFNKNNRFLNNRIDSAHHSPTPRCPTSVINSQSPLFV